MSNECLGTMNAQNLTLGRGSLLLGASVQRDPGSWQGICLPFLDVDTLAGSHPVFPGLFKSPWDPSTDLLSESPLTYVGGGIHH